MNDSTHIANPAHKSRRTLRLLMTLLVVAGSIAALLYWDDASTGKQAKLQGSLIAAVRRSDAQEVHRLLDAGATANIFVDPATDRPLLERPSLLHIVQRLIRRSKPPTPDRVPVLSIAITYNRNEIVALLIERGADLDAPDGKGSTPLHYAAQFGNRDALLDLLERHPEINRKNRMGNTPLHLAVASASIDPNRQLAVNVQLLLEHNADTNIANAEGITPLDTVALECMNLHREWLNASLQNLASKQPDPPERITRNYQHRLDQRKQLVVILQKHGAKSSVETQRLLTDSFKLEESEILDLLKPDGQN